jgi:NADH-quinone oxidoreductase subunit M
VALVIVGVFVQVGVYGWLRFVLPLFSELLTQHAESFTTLAGLSSLFTAAVAFGERDWRRRVALATCSSVGLSLMCVMTQTLEGLTGGVLRVLSHGLTAALLVWLLPSRLGTLACPALDRDENKDGQECPSHRRSLLRFALFAWIGFPGLRGFVAEFVGPFGLFQHAFNAAALSLMTSGLIAWMWVRAEREPPDWSHEQWTRRDVCVASLLIGLNVGLGVAPQLVIDRLQPSLLPMLPADRVASDVEVH